MNKAKLIILPLISLSLCAQNLDEDFLARIPDDIKKDLQKKNEQQNLASEENYRPYLYSSKLSQAEELLTLKDRIEQDLLELERRLNADEALIANKELKLFGSDFFNTFQTTFMPTNEPNPDTGYSLDIGDVLEIQFMGQNNYIKKFPINRDGSISIPEIRKIIIAGLSLKDASDLIKSKVSEAFIGAEAYISLAEIRDVNILVTGNAKNPGIYTLTGNSNILHALSVAGGINEFGSLREINLIRDNNIIETLDVYDLLINGDYSLRKRLRSGDVIFVEARKNIVTIDGAVYRPAKYEVHDEQNLDSLLKYANGMKKTADLKNITLERILDGIQKTIPIMNKTQFQSIKAVDGDLIYIREFPYKKAKIYGAVLKPGTYTMASDETVNDLIDKAGGYTKNAYIFGAVYQNQDAKLINKQAKQVLYEEFLDNIISISQKNVTENFDLTPIVKLTEEIKNSETNGRVVIDLVNESSFNLYTIKEGDELFIPEKNNVVYVYGETSTEGAVAYSLNENIEYYINKAGGTKKFADTDSIYVLHPNGESQLYKQKRNIFESSPRNKVQIYPGSIIFVPRKLDESTATRLAAQAYVSILGNLGIALASLSSINNN